MRIRLLCALCCCVLLFGCGTKLGKKAGFALDNKYLRIPDDNKLLMPPFLQDDLKSDQK